MCRSHRTVRCFRACMLISGLLATTAVWAAMPEFVKGEVLLAGPPEHHAGLDIKRYYPLSDISVISVTPGEEARSLDHFRTLGKTPTLNLVAKAFFTSGDPYSSYQWHFDNIRLMEAHTLQRGAGVVVAILDSGLHASGDDSPICTVGGWNMVANTPDALDGNGHGTHVAGTVAQATDNGVGVAGVAPESCIMPVKVLDDAGSGGFADIAEGIRWASDHGARVINMSLGIAANYQMTSNSIMDSALDYAYAQGVTVVAAAGNDGFRKNVSYPAIYPTVIAVGATDLLNRKTRYSNFGSGLDLMAPGGDTSADRNGDGFVDGVLQETFDDSGTFSYWFYQGTSMASPHVAAIAALLIANGNATSPDEVRQALQQTSKDLGESGYDNQYGYGLVQADLALQWSVSAPPEEPPVSCTDADGDGVCLEHGDCNDTNPLVYPGFNENGKRRNDGLDNDCNGLIDMGY